MSVKTRAIVDRIEEDIAVLEIGREHVEIPLHFLPPGVKEGEFLTLSIEKEKE